MSNPFNVKVGQVWESCDKRYPNNPMVVIMIYEDRGYATCKMLKGKNLRQVQLIRFRERSNGYRLLKDVVGDAKKEEV